MVGGHATADAHTLADPALRQVGSDVRDLNAAVNSIAQDVTSYATHTAGSTLKTVGSTAGNVAHTATQTAGKAVDGATSTAGKTVDGATHTVIGVEKSALTVVSATYDALNRGWDLNLNVLGTGVKGGGNMLTPTGTISVLDASGHTLGSAKVGHGTCTIHLSALGKNQAVTIHYSGDKTFSATGLQWHAPVGF
jgi:outer membrane murein-binding lipoprotein Lpp